MLLLLLGAYLATAPSPSFNDSTDLLAHVEKRHHYDHGSMDSRNFTAPLLGEEWEEDTAIPSAWPASRSLNPANPPLNRPLPLQIIALLVVFALVRRRS
jgi:hypothetical protein